MGVCSQMEGKSEDLLDVSNLNSTDAYFNLQNYQGENHQTHKVWNKAIAVLPCPASFVT